MKTALAIAAHPDDIEFMMAGTLLLLKQQGYAIHYLNLSSGNGGSVQHDSAITARVRLAEAKQAAALLGAEFHPPFCRDLEIMYDVPTLRQLAAVVREVKPTVVLTHSPVDYMEDHTNTCRLAVTATFARGIPNFASTPDRPAGTYDCTLYHALPHGLRDPLRRPVMAGAFVQMTAVQEQKRQALQAHQSQQHWLDLSQGMNSYLQAMDDMAREVGRQSGKFMFAEGWRRHLHLGFCGPDTDPLQELGADYQVNEAYERGLGWV